MKTLIVVALATFFATSAFAEGKSVSMKGEVIDTVCYLTKGAHGAAHKGCAKACVKQGNPAALLSDGKLYMLLAADGNAAAADAIKSHGGDEVTVTGQRIDKDGLAAILVSSLK